MESVQPSIELAAFASITATRFEQGKPEKNCHSTV